MPSIITATQLRNVLGVSVALYPDADLNNMIDTAEETLLPLLIAYNNAISSVRVENLIAYMTTQSPNFFVTGQSVVLTGCGLAFNGTQTITDTAEFRPYLFTFATAAVNQTATPIIPAGIAYVSGSDAATLYASTPAIESAVMVISKEVFQSYTAATGGQIEGVDFSPAPFQMGKSLASRVSGILGNYLDVSAMVQ